MNNQIKISIIIPSLNAAKYIRQCLDSIAYQSLYDIEILVIDAHSVDGTRDIVNEYIISDGRIHLYNDEKKSTGYAKNLGIQKSRGEYIAIVEPDDYVSADMLEKLYRVACETSADIIKGNYCTTISDYGKDYFFPKSTSVKASDYNVMIDPVEYNDAFLWVKNEWLGIYKRSFLLEHNIVHNETKGAAFQDIGFWFLSFAYARKVVLIRDTVYFYRRDNENASMRNPNKVFDTMIEYEYIYGRLHEDLELWNKIKNIYYCCLFKDNLSVLKRINPSSRTELITSIRNKIISAKSRGDISEELYGDDLVKLHLLINDPRGFDDAIMMREEKCYLKQKIFVDDLKKYNDIIVFGAGSYGCNLHFMLEKQGIKPRAFSDNDMSKIGQTKNGLKVISLHDCERTYNNPLYIVASKNKNEEIKLNLEKRGIDKNRILTIVLEDVLMEII